MRPAERCLCEINRYFGALQNYRRDARNIVNGHHGTIAVWVRPSTAPGDGAMHTYWWAADLDTNPNTGFILTKDFLNQLGFYQVNNLGNSTIVAAATPANFAQNVWHHLLVAFDVAWIRFYLDGALFAQGAASPCLEMAPVGAQYALGYSNLFVPDSAMAWIKNPMYWEWALAEEIIFWLYRNRVGF